jgi:hypothetical protein
MLATKYQNLFNMGKTNHDQKRKCAGLKLLDFWILYFGFQNIHMCFENPTWPQLTGAILAVCFSLGLGSFYYCL